MGVLGAPRVLVVVEPALLGQLLTEILDAVGADDVTNLSGHAVPDDGRPFSVAIVSDAVIPAGVAEIVIVLPGAGETIGQVHLDTGAVRVDMGGPLSVLDALDRFCPAGRRRATATLSNMGMHGTASLKHHRARPPGPSSPSTSATIWPST